MFFKHVWGLMAQPKAEWKSIRDERCTIGKCYCSHVLFLAALPAIAYFIGTSQVGWVIGTKSVRLSTESALHIAALTYLTLLVGVFAMGKAIHWMSLTYGAQQNLPQSIALAAYTATPLFLTGIALIYPILWLDLLIALMALAYTIYLLYIGVPIMMKISQERGFLFASAVMGVGLVMLVGVLAATVVLWDMGDLAASFIS